MEQKGAQFYKLNKSKRYGVEGTQFKVSGAIILAVFCAVCLVSAIALTIINYDVFFQEIAITFSTCSLYGVTAAIVAFGCVRYRPVFQKRRFARKIIKNCTLTDGKVIKINQSQVRGYTSSKYYSYTAVRLMYSFCDADGNLRYGELAGNYAEVPFYCGQNLMIAFNDTGSVIMSEFALLDGEDFERAEAERSQGDDTGLTGELLKIDLSKPIGIADYAWSAVLKTDKRVKRLDRILVNNPSFTVGRLFVKKRTYRRKAGNQLFYCYLDTNGARREGECEGIQNLNDGDGVVVAYGGGESEIVTRFTLIEEKPPKKRKR